MGRYDPLRRYLTWWTKAHFIKRCAQAWPIADWRIKSVDRGAEQVAFTQGEAVARPALPTPAVPVRLTAQSDPHIGETSRWSRAGEIGAAVIAAAAAGASEIVGLAHLPWPVLLTLAASVGAIAWTLTQAMQSRKSAERGYGWWAASTALLVLLAGGAFLYHKVLDPATHPRRTYEFVVNGGQDNVIPLYGEAGGPAQILATGVANQNALIGGQGYAFDCWIVAPDGSQWLRYERFNQTWWAPRKYLHTPFGERTPSLPNC